MRAWRAGVAVSFVALQLVAPAARAQEAAEAEAAALSLSERPALLSLDAEGRIFELYLHLAERLESLSSFPIDAAGTSFDPELGLNTLIRVGGKADTAMTLAPWRVSLNAEYDILTGTHTGGPTGDLDTPDYPAGDELESELRQLWIQLDYTRETHLLGGFMVSHWGLGLLANDGAHGWTPGSAAFLDPRGGDRVLRGVIAVGPFASAADLMLAAGFDQVQDDETLLDGDEATQGIGTVRLGLEDGLHGGVYAVVRRQTTEDEARLDVQVIDGTATLPITLDAATLTLAAELAFIWGETELGPNADFAVHDVRQLGGALRAAYDAGSWGSVLDVFYASGDDNLDDDRLTGFRIDPNFSAGLLLYSQVLSAQTARSPATASDPELIGVPPEDLERLPTRGSPTNTLAFFPRGWWRPLEGLEIYGGPLFALVADDIADARNTRLAGGIPHNALNGTAGAYLGTELDLGVRWWANPGGVGIQVGAEGGLLLPGDALQRADGSDMDTVYGGRVMVELAL